MVICCTMSYDLVSDPLALGTDEMESALLERDKVGVQDFVLLNNHLSLDEFIENLEKRFKHDLIYVSFIHYPKSLLYHIYYTVWAVLSNNFLILQ